MALTIIRMIISIVPTVVAFIPTIIPIIPILPAAIPTVIPSINPYDSLRSNIKKSKYPAFKTQAFEYPAFNIYEGICFRAAP